MFWKPFRAAGMCVRGRGSGPGGQRHQRPCPDAICPSLLTFLCQCGPAISVSQSGLPEDPAPMSGAVGALAF